MPLARWLPRFAALLAHPRLPWLAALLGVLLASPALGTGLWLDDHLHRFVVGMHVRGEGLGPWWDLYVAAEGDQALTRARMDVGFSPWWTVPELRVRFLRPLPAATHYLDYAAWPGAAWWMHAQSLAWYGGLVVAVGTLLRRWLGATWIAGLATLLYAIDDAHATPVAWIAQRNALIAAVLVVLMLIAHDRWSRDGWRPGAWLAPLLLLLALLAGEGSIAALGLLGAQVWLLPLRLDRKEPWSVRVTRALRSLRPFVAVVVVWRLVYDALGYGAAGSGVYLDPLREPAAFLAVLPDRMAALLLAQVSGPSAERWSTDPMPWEAARWGALAVVALGGLVLGPRLRCDRGLLVALAGAGMALVPAATTVPADRMLLLVGVGGSAAVAAVVAVAMEPGARSSRRWLAVGLGLPLLGMHGVWSPIALPARVVALPRALEQQPRAVVASLPDDPELAEQELVIANAPPTFVSSTLWLMRWNGPEPLPRRLRQLGAAWEPVVVHRPDAHTLVLQPVGGYFGDPWSAIARGRAHPFAVGDRVELAGMTVEILGVAKGLPTVVRVRFEVPLEDPSLRWVTWQGERFVPWAPPEVGQTVALSSSPPRS
ncbi:hypothetical protein [Paraliomyxa miuraensis]|uniref:hypothetical protein n=1 Tax=Paraliomyxa miuraensis TaxID=376150 RepID=UPI00224E9E6D|nr:hypothetical protein [Paraliomyxa miuraensis]MCX4242258.1 hypothetical protein [Paraliomyxa miuraensis]